MTRVPWRHFIARIRRFTTRPGALIPLVFVVLLLIPATALAQDDPLSVFQRFTDGRNNRDAATVLGLVSDNISFIGGSGCPPTHPCIGKDGVRGDYARVVADNLHLSIVGTPEVSGTTVKARLELRSDVTKAAGVDRFLTTATADVSNGKIVSYRSTPDTSDPQTVTYLTFVRAQQTVSTLPRSGEPPFLPIGLGLGTLLAAMGLALRTKMRRV